MPILSVRSALPGHRYPQAQLTDAFAEVISPGAGLDEAVLRRLHRNAGVESRHVVLPLEQYAELGDFGARQRPVHRARRRARLPRAGRRPQGGGPDARRDVDLVVAATVTGLAVPSLEARIAAPVGLRPGREADAAGRPGLRRRRGRDRPRARLPASVTPTTSPSWSPSSSAR